MPSFDVVNQIDIQEVDNAVNNTKKEVGLRYDFRGSNTEIELNRKEKKIHVVAADPMKLDAVRDMLFGNFAKRKVDLKSVQLGEPQPTSKGHLKMDITIREGIDRDNASKIVKKIKETGLKVQAAIQDEQVRVTGKKIDDLQAVIQMLRGADLEVPLQYINMKS